MWEAMWEAMYEVKASQIDSNSTAEVIPIQADPLKKH